MNIQQPPALDHDAFMLKRFNEKVSANGKLERRIVYNLGLYLKDNGFDLLNVWDTETSTDVTNIKEAMELLFNLDDAFLNVKKQGFAPHFIFFTFGEGIDIINDWSYGGGDKDGFDAAMDAFDVEQFG